MAHKKTVSTKIISRFLEAMFFKLHFQITILSETISQSFVLRLICWTLFVFPSKELNNKLWTLLCTVFYIKAALNFGYSGYTFSVSILSVLIFDGYNFRHLAKISSL